MRGLLPVVVMMSALPVPVHAQDAGAAAASIVTHSPFLPPGYQPPGGAGSTTDAPASPSQYEFHGVYQLEGTYYFNLFNSRERKGSWISKDTSDTEWPRIVRYEEEADLLIVEVAGEQVSLTLINTSDKPLAIAATRPAQAVIQGANATTQQAPPRRRVIRPTVRPAETQPVVRRPTIQPPSQQ